HKIAVEIKSFVGRSQINDLENALGQYILYYEILLEQQDTRVLYLAIKQSAYQEIFEEPIGKILLKRKIINLLVFDEMKEVILQWIS
ncbi:MAG: element excision factor XisH family protein, partial [Xenococcus sp. (in: cyanobacteria)]